MTTHRFKKRALSAFEDKRCWTSTFHFHTDIHRPTYRHPKESNLHYHLQAMCESALLPYVDVDFVLSIALLYVLFEIFPQMEAYASEAYESEAYAICT